MLYFIIKEELEERKYNCIAESGASADDREILEYLTQLAILEKICRFNFLINKVPKENRIATLIARRLWDEIADEFYSTWVCGRHNIQN